jgi:cytochrome c oxidase subunit II
MLNNFWHVIGGDKAQFWPNSASSFVQPLDRLSLYLLAISITAAALIFILLIVFSYKYRHRPGNEIARDVPDSHVLEAAWTVIPLAVILVAFYFGSLQFLKMSSPPQGTESLFIVGKQWMWKIEHENGISEINEIHVPVGHDLQILMISQDVIHSLFVPDFRMKFDVLPGRYTRAWFHADQIGHYRIFCTQYCGTDHSAMTGFVTVMTEKDYADWVGLYKNNKHLAQAQPLAPETETAEERGEKIFGHHGCDSCHRPEDNAMAPSLRGLFGHPVTLQDGTSVVADASYLRESILNPGAKVVAGYQNVMPAFAGQFTEEQIFDLLAYMRSLNPNAAQAANSSKNTVAHE